ncbi:MAG TPA: TMEM175 family protein [Sphingobacteriaceae bacterium]|nr:TMEM175 family protein [Sphingobacteriaceae bacterium]
MRISTARVETFSDCVIGIIITIMVLELKLSDLNKIDSTQGIMSYLTKFLPYFITYAFSFMMIGIFWTNHHHMFHLLQRTDEQLLWQNFVFLFFLSLIPFATALVGANPFLPISPAIYGFVMLLTTLSFVLMRSYSLRNNLAHTDENKELTRKILKVSLRARTKSIIGTIIYLISIPLAYVNVYFSYICFIIPPIIFFIPDGIDNEELAELVVEKN